MKTNPTLLLPAALALLAVSSLQAQTVHSVVVGKSSEFLQTGASAVAINPAPTTSTYGGPFGFTATVEGTGLTAPTVTLAAGSTIGSTYPGAHNGGVLGFNADEEDWQYGSPNFNNWGSPSAAERNQLFANGLYGFSIPDVGSVALNLVPAPSETGVGGPPVFTLSGGTWNDGVYEINAGQAMTLTTQVFASFDDNVDGHIFFGIWDTTGNTTLVEIERLFSEVETYTDGTDNRISYTINPASNGLIAGHTYEVGAAYAVVVDRDESVSFFTAAFFEASTTFTLSAIPEPSTYAMLAGIGALGLAAWQRRRRTGVASAITR